MVSITELGRLQKVDLRDAWPHEAHNFTPWLAQEENLRLLGDTLGLEMELEAVEKAVDSFSADILARDTIEGGWILIENQLEQTNHSHLGQILTYAAGLNAKTVVWIAREFREPHRAAVDYLNEVSSQEYNFFGVQLELYRIGDSPLAPRFDVVAKPNGWSKRLVARTKEGGALAATKQEWVDYWTRFIESPEAGELKLAARVPPKEGWCRVEQLRSGDASVATWLHNNDVQARVVLWVQGPFAKAMFDHLSISKNEIERELGTILSWDRMDGKKSSMIAIETKAGDGTGEAAEFKWLAEWAAKFATAFRPRVVGVDSAALVSLSSAPEPA
ncbi:DUF4268 domain-containing protein [Allosphingosinicella indica]|uniref:DUF4268 domain-containing protein n=1 Tax=Allosphingosinicella indica TaxID=941907 RepID=A0A1X7GN55_9SPHN|nr:DUF4268 domain-containing protein [Allosphingosinicella indica]SMF72093.1 protein of unknown function [Allosphingosinicella indica]